MTSKKIEERKPIFEEVKEEIKNPTLSSDNKIIRVDHSKTKSRRACLFCDTPVATTHVR